MVPASTGEAGSDVYVISRGGGGGGEASSRDSGSSPIWTHSMDAIPAGKLYILLIMLMMS